MKYILPFTTLILYVLQQTAYPGLTNLKVFLPILIHFAIVLFILLFFIITRANKPLIDKYFKDRP